MFDNNQTERPVARARWAAIGAAFAVCLGAGGLGVVNAATSSGERAIYKPIEPCRMADTRPGTNNVGDRTAPLGPDDTYTLNAWGAIGNCTADDLPEGATALALNVTAVEATTPTFVTLFPAGTTRPDASNLNPTPAVPAPLPNAVNVDLNGTGDFSVFNRFGNVHVIIDVVGVYDDHNHDDRYYTKAEGALKSNAGRIAYVWACESAVAAPIGSTTDAVDCIPPALLLAGGPSSPSAPSDPPLHYSSSGEPINITKEDTGQYSVNFSDLDMDGGHVQVSPYGTKPALCNVVSWSPSTIDVWCYDTSGAPADSPFTLLAID